MASTRLSHNDYSVGWICALSEERTAATVMLDEEHEDLPISNPNDKNSYTLGVIGKHNVVLACLPEGEMGTNSAANVVTQMVNTFPSIKFGLMVGIGGGIPPHVRLGDIVVSKPVGEYPGVVQWDFGKDTSNGFVRTGSLDRPPKALLSALTKLKTKHDIGGHKISQSLKEIANKWPKLAGKYTWSDRLKDTLFEPDDRAVGGWQTMFVMLWQTIVALLSYLLGRGELGRVKRNTNIGAGAVGEGRIPGDPVIHYGLIASGNRVIKDSSTRDEINQRLGGQVLCIEMEAAGVMNSFPCLVIRGICDYADSKKNDHWQEYAAGIAAAYTKEFLQFIQPAEIERQPPVKDILYQVHDHIVATRAGVATVQSKIDKQEDNKILDWLTPTDYGPSHSHYCKKRQPETGGWFLEHKEFRYWLTGSNNILFCHGIPGAGKTILTSLVISHLHSKFSCNSEIGIAFLYFNYRRQEEQDFESLLANLLKQLAGGRYTLPESTKALYNQHALKRTRPLAKELIQDLEYVVSQYKQLFIVLDALDECELFGLKQFIFELFSFQKDHKMKILATSRPIPEITDLFDRMNSNKLEIRAETSDVKKYIEGHLELIPNVARRDAALKEKIKTDISETVDGMFLLAEIYLTLLQDKMTVNGVRKQLATFKSQPNDRHDDQKAKTLANAYGQAMNRVNSQKEGLRNLAMGALAWITFSKREITTPELQHALATQYGMHTLNHDDLPDLKDIGSVCIGLITVDERRGIIRLVHYTAQQYLEQTRDHWFPDADEMIWKCCITYLSFEDFKSGVCETDTEYAERNKSFPLLNYAASYWGHHISEELESAPAVISFLRSQTQVEASIQTHFFGKNPFYLDATPPSTMSGLHVAAMFGMVEATRTLLELGCSPNVEGSYNHTPLLWASYYGHEAVARLLLDEGAFETEDWVDGRTPLMWAVEMGHTAVVKLLLEKGSEVNLQDHCSQTPLSLATEKGFKTIVELLLEAGAVYEVNDSEYERIPLMQAIKKGDEATVKVLLTRRSKVNFHDAFGKTPLFLAAEKGHKSIVRLLLNAGADLEAKNTTNQRTPLAAAIMHRQKGVVDILLRKGANLHTRDTFDQTPLFIAVGLGNRAIIRQLLDRGADVNARNCDGETPLFFAAALGHVEAIELLHTKGARCNETNNEGKTPLFFAAAVAQSAAIKALVDRGADINARDIQGRTALFSAVESGDEAVVKMMLDMDRIDISGSDAMGLTPTSLARICAHSKGNGGGILQLLLQKGNIRGFGFGR